MQDHDAPLTYGNARPERPSLGELLDTLERTYMIVDEQVDRLAGKLAPVLEPERPREAPGLVQQGGPSSALRDRLGSLHARLDGLHSTLVAITERVDL